MCIDSGAGPEFEGFLRRIAKDIITRAVRDIVEKADRIVFEEEVSDVSNMYV